MDNVSGELIMTNTESASDSSIEDVISEALNLYSLGEYSKSLELYDSLLLIDNNNVNALYSKGVIKVHQNEINEAIKYFEKVNNIIPNHPPTVANLSYLLEGTSPIKASDYAKIALITYPDMIELKRISNIALDEAKDDLNNEKFEKQSEILTESSITTINEEEILLVSKPVEEEEIDILDLLSLNEKTSEDKARELNEIGDYIGAVKLWKEILERKPKSPEAWNGLSESLEKAGYTEKAKQCRNKASILESENELTNKEENRNINLEKESEEILYHENIEEDLNYKNSVNTSIEWYNKGINFLAEEKSSDALSCFEKSIGGCPKEEKELRVRSQNGRGDALYQMGKYSESILAYHAAISLEPSFLTGRTLYNMGQSYAFLELYEDALKCFEQSIGRGLEKDGVDLCKTQMNRCKLLLREQNKRK